MKKHFLFLALASVLLLGCAKQQVRVACVGDSITEGCNIHWQSNFAYPTYLAQILGTDYEVMNFGRSATTMLYGGDFPYWSAKEFTNTLRYCPDIVLLKLGTNDSKPQNWNAEKYEESYLAMVDTFRSINPKMRIIACLPAPVVEDHWGITDSVVVNGVVPVIKRVAVARQLEVLDFYEVLSAHKDLFGDGVHPTAEGAKVMAEAAADFILGKE